MGNEFCCDDTKVDQFGQRPPSVNITKQPSSNIQKPSSLISPGAVPQLSDEIKDHMSINSTFSHNLEPFEEKLSHNPKVKQFGNDYFEGVLDSVWNFIILEWTSRWLWQNVQRRWSTFHWLFRSWKSKWSREIYFQKRIIL